MSKRVTAKDVAAQAGVSRSAVSMVLGGRADGQVSTEKQERVLRVAHELGYVPNALGKSLRAQRTQTIGLVTDVIVTSAYGGKLVFGAQEFALSHGFLTLIVDTESVQERESEAVDVLLSRQVEGLLFVSLNTRPVSIPPAMTKVPAVVANGFDPTGAVTGVYCDEVEGGRRAARALLDAGHRDITLLTGPPTFVTRGRIEGYRDAMATSGLEPREPIETGWSIREGFAAGTAVLEQRPPPTGILCANDRVAMGVALAAARLGIDVPRDVSLVGYDDDENVAPCMVPALTSVALPHEQIGRESARRLVAAIAGQRAPAPEQVLVVGDLIERDSVTAPPDR